jgi:hypothetical protein
MTQLDRESKIELLFLALFVLAILFLSMVEKLPWN